MPQFLVRNVSEPTAAALRSRAARNGRSVEAEHRALLDEALLQPDADWRDVARRCREMTRGRSDVPSWVLIREARDER